MREEGGRRREEEGVLSSRRRNKSRSTAYCFALSWSCSARQGSSATVSATLFFDYVPGSSLATAISYFLLPFRECGWGWGWGGYNVMGARTRGSAHTADPRRGHRLQFSPGEHSRCIKGTRELLGTCHSPVMPGRGGWARVVVVVGRGGPDAMFTATLSFKELPLALMPRRHHTGPASVQVILHLRGPGYCVAPHFALTI